VIRFQKFSQVLENSTDLGGLVEKLDHQRQIHEQVQQARGVHAARPAETRDSAEHGHAAHLLVVVQLGQQLIEQAPVDSQKRSNAPAAPPIAIART
jgi:hypothetical protein